MGNRVNADHVFILAFDGLEYDLVVRFKLRNLLQSEYGKVDISDFNVKATPILWYSFITGLPPKEEPLREFGGKLFSPETHVKRSMLSKILEYCGWLQRAIPLQFWNVIIRSGVAYKYMHTMVNYHRCGVETIFDRIKPSIALFVPTYSPILERKVIALTNAIGKKSLEEEYERIVWRNLRAKLRVCVRRLRESKNWKLFMVHFFFTDQLGHLHRGEILKMLKIYAIANRIARILKAMVPKNTLFLIISDHGMKVIPGTKYGDHSEYGFYSLNIPLGLKKPKIYHFAHVIERVVRAG